jgi:hypothetical protein
MFNPFVTTASLPALEPLMRLVLNFAVKSHDDQAIPSPTNNPFFRQYPIPGGRVDFQPASAAWQSICLDRHRGVGTDNLTSGAVPRRLSTFQRWLAASARWPGSQL